MQSQISVYNTADVPITTVNTKELSSWTNDSAQVSANVSRDFLHGENEPLQTVNGLQGLDDCLRTLTFHPARL